MELELWPDLQTNLNYESGALTTEPSYRLTVFMECIILIDVVSYIKVMTGSCWK